MKYLVTGSTIVNSIKYLDGSMIKNVMGGCVIYSFAGVRMLTEDCGIATDVGEDFDEYFAKWFDDNNIGRDCLNVLDPHTMNTILEYRADGSYWDHSIWGGDDMYHNRDYVLNNLHWAKYAQKATRGVYCFNNLDGIYEEKLKYGFKTMFEVKCNANAAYRETFLNNIWKTDLFSINFNECCAVFGLKTEEECIKKLFEFEKPCFFRLGSKGAMMLDEGKTYFVPIVRIGPPEIDPTGCGNSSTAGAMWGILEGYDPLMTTCIANTVSGYNALQYGPVLQMDGALSTAIMKKAEDVWKEMKTTSSVLV